MDISKIFKNASSENRNVLLEHEVYEILSSLGVRTPKYKLITNKEIGACDKIKIPGDKIVLKVVSSEILHKTEVQGVKICRNDPKEIKKNVEGLFSALPKIVGVLACEYIDYPHDVFGRELLFGLRWTRECGHIINFGVGGVHTEFFNKKFKQGCGAVIGEASTCGITDWEDVVEKTSVYNFVSGKERGCGKILEKDKVLNVIKAFSSLAQQYSNLNPKSEFLITECEVNPFVVKDGELIAIDGLLKFEKAKYSKRIEIYPKVEKILKPKSAAIIGVSEKMNVGRIILKNLLKYGFDKNEIFVVKEGLSEIDGCRCYKDIASLPKKVDLFINSIDAAQAERITKELIEYDKAESVIVIPGGMAEKEGAASIEDNIKRLIEENRKKGKIEPVFNGGNCLGIKSLPGKYNTFFIPYYKVQDNNSKFKNVAFVSQSGACVIAQISSYKTLNPLYSISTGNQIDLTVSDYFNYLKDDKEVDVYALYLEGSKDLDGYELMKVAKQITDKGKYVVFYKAGRTAEGRSATQGHTASIAGDYAVCKALMQQAGAVVCESFDEFADMIKICSMLSKKKVSGNCIAAMSNAGYESVGMADNIKGEGYELKLAKYTDETKNKILETYIKGRFDKIANIKNPLDVTPMANDEAYEGCVKALLDADNINAVVVGVVPLSPVLQTLAKFETHKEDVASEAGIARRIIKLAVSSDKPLICVVDSGVLFDPLSDLLEKEGVPVFRKADRAMKALGQYVSIRL